MLLSTCLRQRQAQKNGSQYKARHEASRFLESDHTTVVWATSCDRAEPAENDVRSVQEFGNRRDPCFAANVIIFFAGLIFAR